MWNAFGMRSKCTERSQNLASSGARKYVHTSVLHPNLQIDNLYTFEIILTVHRGVVRSNVTLTVLYNAHGGLRTRLISLHAAFCSLIALVFRFADYVRSTYILNQQTRKKKSFNGLYLSTWPTFLYTSRYHRFPQLICCDNQYVLYLFVWKPPPPPPFLSPHTYVRTKRNYFLFTRQRQYYIHTSTPPSHRNIYFYWPLMSMAYLLHGLCEYHLNHRPPAIRWSMIGMYSLYSTYLYVYIHTWYSVHKCAFQRKQIPWRFITTYHTTSFSNLTFPALLQ